MLKRTEFEWQTRERARIVGGEHKQVPEQWHTTFREGGTDCVDKIYLNYYPHVSKLDPSKIAYTENPTKGEKDVQTQIKPGKFLKKVLPDLPDTKVQELVQAFNGNSISGVLRFAIDEAHIVFVYRNGPNSCMGHETSCYRTGSVHPVSVYASGDIGIAYVENPNNAGKISARVVVNFLNKQYSRVYGETSMIKPLLENAGWEYSDTALKGARMLKRTNNDGDIIAPYLDGCCQSIEVNGKYLHIGHDGDYNAVQTNGLLESGYFCHHCENAIDENDCRSGGDYDYCDDCWHEFFFHCEDCSETTCNDDGVAINEGSYYVCDGCFDRDYFTCGECSENKHTDDHYDDHHHKGAICTSCDHHFVFTECCDTLFHNSEEGCDCEKEEEETENKEVANA